LPFTDVWVPKGLLNVIETGIKCPLPPMTICPADQAVLPLFGPPATRTVGVLPSLHCSGTNICWE
jgi:hypothetical protein